MRFRALFLGVCLAGGIVAFSGPPMGILDTMAAADPHAYFNALKARADFWKGVSLRPVPGTSCTSGGYTGGLVAEGTCNPDFETQLTGKEDIDGLRNGSTPSTPEAVFVKYDFAGDPDRHKQDAAKLVIQPFGTRGTLGAAIGATDGNITVVSDMVPNIGTSQGLRVDNEIMLCDASVDMNPAASGNQCFLKGTGTYTVHVARGQFGTAAAPHAAGVAFKTTVNGLDPAAQLRYPLHTKDGNTYIFTFDFYFTDSWIGVGLAGDTAAKFFQFSNTNTFWLETDFPYKGGDSSSGKCVGYDAGGGANSFVSGVWLRSYNGAYAGAASWAATDGSRVGPNVTNTSELQPMGPAPPPNSGFCVKPNTWTRIWYKIQQKANDYDLLDMWVADETRDAVKLFEGIQLSVATNGGRPNEITKWWVEGNNTYTQHTLGSVNPFRDRVMYLRNFAALRNPATIAEVLQRPVPGLVPAPSTKPAAPTGLRIVK